MEFQMAKDPAFLFYTQDFIMGTMFMSNEQVGIYVRLLCSQHQHGGLIDKESFSDIVGNHNIVKRKFIETDDGFYNERLMSEMEKRSIKSSNLSDNAKKRWESSKQNQCKSNAKASKKHMPIEDENEIVFKYLKDNIFNKTFKDYLDMRKKIRKPATDRAKEMVLAKLHKFKLDIAIKMLEQSILNSWQGIFEIKEDGKLDQKSGRRDYSEIIEKKLGRMATVDMIKDTMRIVPAKMWWQIDKYLKKRYTDGVSGFPEAERQMSNEIRQ